MSPVCFFSADSFLFPRLPPASAPPSDNPPNQVPHVNNPVLLLPQLSHASPCSYHRNQAHTSPRVNLGDWFPFIAPGAITFLCLALLIRASPGHLSSRSAQLRSLRQGPCIIPPRDAPHAFSGPRLRSLLWFCLSDFLPLQMMLQGTFSSTWP